MVFQLVENHSPVTPKKGDAVWLDVAMVAANIWPSGALFSCLSSVCKISKISIHTGNNWIFKHDTLKWIFMLRVLCWHHHLGTSHANYVCMGIFTSPQNSFCSPSVSQSGCQRKPTICLCVSFSDFFSPLIVIHKDKKKEEDWD